MIITEALRKLKLAIDTKCIIGHEQSIEMIVPLSVYDELLEEIKDQIRWGSIEKEGIVLSIHGINIICKDLKFLLKRE